MKGHISRFLLKPAVVAFVLATAGAFAGGEMVQPVPGPTPVPGVGGVTTYNEYFCYSAVARRSYVPAYTPHATSLFENPREYPSALCVMGTPYHRWAGIPGWFFGSPMGYQTSVPPGSHALAYFRGETGATAKMASGLPEGMRVVEDVVVPYPQFCRRGGFLINAGAAAEPLSVTLPGPEPGVAQPAPMPTPAPMAVPQLAK